jgi:hypothetical protein
VEPRKIAASACAHYGWPWETIAANNKRIKLESRKADALRACLGLPLSVHQFGAPLRPLENALEATMRSLLL